MATPENQHCREKNQHTCAPRQIQVAIDGPAGAGKSSVARRVADRLGYLYVDTGAMYRAAAWLVLKENINLQNLEVVANTVAKADISLSPGDSTSAGRARVFVDGHEVTTEIRSLPVTRLVSPVSAIPAVRQHLVIKQQQLAESGGIIMDGRDIGTVVLPNADIKIFLTASPAVRAQRRLTELQELGQEADYVSLLQDIKDRDAQDSSRTVAPLRQAQDAIAINTDKMTIEEVVDTIIKLCQKQVAHRT